MGRLPKVRVSYYNDAQFLLRLMHAIERDKSRPMAWRKACIAELSKLASKLMMAPASKEAA